MIVQDGRVFLEPAVILHRRPYRETSLLLDVFSENHGRIRLLAKGAKRGKNSPAGILQPFLRLRLSWTGRGDLPVLTGAESTLRPMDLHGTAIFCGFYLNELVLNLLPTHDPHPEAFRLYLATLGQLGPQAEAEREAALRYFELAFLDEIGYGLSLDREAGGNAIDPAKLYAYQPDEGPVAIDVPLADAICGETLLGLSRRNLGQPEHLRQAKRLMRRVIDHHLNGRRLRSRDLFKTIGRPESS